MIEPSNIDDVTKMQLALQAWAVVDAHFSRPNRRARLEVLQQMGFQAGLSGASSIDPAKATRFDELTGELVPVFQDEAGAPARA